MSGMQPRAKSRVVVTGMGVVSPVGLTAPETFENFVAGKNGVGPITLIDASKFDVHFAGEVKGFAPEKYMPRKEARHLDRFAQFSMAASLEAVADAKLDGNSADLNRVGVLLGTGIGGIGEMEEQYRRFMEGGPSRISPFVIPKLMGNAASANVSIRLGFKGPNFCVVTACASAAHSIGEAYRMVQSGVVDAVLCGGSEAGIRHLGLGGFCALKALSTRNDDYLTASRPFDKDRDGFVLGEGAGVVVLESLEHARRRGVRIHAELTGYGLSGDAYHITAPAEDGDGGIRAMRMCLDDAGLRPEDIQYINAHGTSTPYNDKIETMAIKRVFESHARKLAVSSIKSMVGHLLGAAGGVSLVSTIYCINRSIVTPTINYFTPDPDCDLDYVPNKARPMEIRNALINALGFGGHNATLCVSKFVE